MFQNIIGVLYNPVLIGIIVIAEEALTHHLVDIFVVLAELDVFLALLLHVDLDIRDTRELGHRVLLLLLVWVSS